MPFVTAEAADPVVRKALAEGGRKQESSESGRKKEPAESRGGSRSRYRREEEKLRRTIEAFREEEGREETGEVSCEEDG